MNTQQKILLQDIIDVTSPGPVTRWSDRMAEVAKRAGVKIELINWYQSPKAIAIEIVEYSRNNNSLECLETAIKEYRYEVQK